MAINLTLPERIEVRGMFYNPKGFLPNPGNPASK
jgi:hypothetical protein